jgi:hypothetical protein
MPTNYKLTTNLIVDCHSLKKLNGKQKDINFYIDCLRTIQEFQEPNPLYIQAIETYNKNWIDRVVDSSMQTTKLIQELKYAQKIGCELLPKTIASATLHGQGEFPPSTLEELCESYKNVMIMKKPLSLQPYTE